MKLSNIILTGLLFVFQPIIAQSPFLVKDIYKGVFDANPTSFTKAGNALYFLANDGTTNFELWKTAGDSAFLVKDIYPGATISSIRYLTSIGNTVYFSAEDGINGHELWKAEGDTAFMIKDINPNGNSLPQNLFVMEKDLYFTAGDGVTGRELWRLHNDSVFLVQDLNKGSLGSNPGSFTIFGNMLYFTAAIGTNTDELWMTDGDSIYKVKGIPYKRFATPQNLITVGNAMYFSAETSTTGRELWKAIGDTAFMVKDIYKGTSASNPSNFTVIDSTLYFTAEDGIVGNELRKLQNDSVYLIKDINTGISSSKPYDLTAVGNAIYFVADEGVNIRKLWKIYKDTTYKVHVPSIMNAATIAQITVLRNSMYFNANSPSVGSELWLATDDTVLLVKDIYPSNKSSNPLDLEVVGDVLYFVAENGSTGNELWIALGNSAFLVKDLVAGAVSSSPSNLIAVDNTLYFSADDVTHGRELWSVRAPILSFIDTVACNAYRFGNVSLTQTGRYFDTLISSNKGDSIIILDLIINSINSEVSKNNSVLTALANNAKYQWLNCNQANVAIQGAINKTYTAESSGSFAVEIRQNGCIDTSDCVEVKLAGIGSQDKIAGVKVYPNPAKNSLFIEYKGNVNEVITVEMHDVNGRHILSDTQLKTLSEIQVGDLARGIYFLKITSLNKFKFYTIVLN